MTRHAIIAGFISNMTNIANYIANIVSFVIMQMRPYATEETLTKDLQEKLTWKDHRDSTMKDTARKFKRHKKLLADPRLPRPALLPSL